MLASFAELLRPTILPAIASSFRERRRGIGSRSAPRAPLLISSTPSALPPKSPPILDTLRLLEWDKLCDHVASFAGTSHGREATKMKLWSLDVSFQETLRLLRETAAAVEMIKCGIGGLDFRGVDTIRVKSAIERALRGSIINGKDAMAVAIIIQSAKTLQFDLKAYAKRDASWYNRFMPLTIAISDLPATQAFFNSVHEVIDADGSVKDTASSELKNAREQLRFLEKKLYQLMEKFIRVGTSEIAIINGRWCIKVASDHSTKFEGLLLSSVTGSESLIEPLAVVPVNDELQQARLFARKAEQDVLSKLTNEMLNEIDDIGRLFDAMIQLDVVVARAKYSTTYGGSYPDLSLPEEKMSLLNSEIGAAVNYVPVTIQPHASRRKWKLYARGAYHPLLLKNYRENLMLARKDVDDAVSELGRMRLQGQDLISSDNIELTIASLQLKAAKIEENRPVPVDITVSAETNVVVITGPNTGGKTISLKTVGLAVLMAKIGLYVIASEPVQMPWFDAVFADIGDEQSLSQSLSTFSSHLMKIGAIQSISTEQSLVLLDEVGAGTNPLEGAALGMSLLESFAKSGTLLTIATTHHGELKTLKYSNHLFDNACMEFDEINLQPTYRILWGVPGRSNAINIAERLGLSRSIVDTARLLYGTASAEINEIILEMETSKQDFEHHLQEAQETIRLARQHHERLLAAKQRINNHALKLRSRKLEEVMDAASLTRSSLQSMMRKIRELRKMQTAQSMSRVTGSTSYEKGYDKLSPPEKTQEETSLSSESYDGLSLQKANRTVTLGKALNELPKEGDKVYVSVLGKSGRVLKVYQSKAEVMVQVDRMKLRLKFTDIGHQPLQR